MKILFTVCITVFLFSSSRAQAQDSVVGYWKTIDDETNEAKSIVQIYKKDGEIFGKIVKLFREPNEDQDPICTKCPSDDARYKKKVIGMEIIKGLKKKGSAYEGGTVLKPDEGKIYKCKIWKEGNKLMVRGYWGFFYRTQEWLQATKP